jgi:hypothetical protein
MNQIIAGMIYEGRVGILLTGLNLPHFCACTKSEPGFPTSYVMVFPEQGHGHIPEQGQMRSNKGVNY